MAAPAPSRTYFDPYNGSATGHQRCDNGLAGSTSWRASRSAKLGHQFGGGGAGGGKRVCDSVGAGSVAFGRDGRKANGGWEVGAAGLREEGWQDVRGLFGVNGGGKAGVGVAREGVLTTTATGGGKREGGAGGGGGGFGQEGGMEGDTAEEKNTDEGSTNKNQRKMFDGLCVYINGSTAPLVSDHKLKYLLAEHGARVSISLGRRSVTHVVLGTPNGRAAGNGAGGGLAAGKMQKEIARVRGCGVKYVGVEWVLESIKAGIRLPEAQFSTVRIAAKGQKSVYGMFKSVESGSGGKGGVAAETDQLTNVHDRGKPIR